MKKMIIAFVLLAFSQAAVAQLKNVEHVILIGVDGFGAYAFEKAEIPNIRSLMKRGSWSLEARSVLPSSSAVNWASMLMGAGPELHGFTTWGSKKPDMPSRVLDKYGMFPSVYGLLREKEPNAEIGVIYEWEGIGYLFPKEAVDLDRHCASDSISAATAIDYIREKKPDFLFLYFHNVDVTGHQTGHDTPAYYEAVEGVDAHIGQVLEVIGEAGMKDNTVVMLSADHGGTGKGHGGVSMAEMQIPWIIAGPGIKQDYEVQGSIMTFDTAATLARIFGLQPPQVWIGRAVNEVFTADAEP